MTATEILEQLLARYKGCHSYSDRGIVHFPDVQGKPEQLEFRTEFERPDYFSFEWQDYGPRRGKSERFSMLWSNVHQKSLVRRDTSSRVAIEEEPSLSLAIAGATGCSAGAAHIVPSLLIEALSTDCKTLASLIEMEITSEESIDGTTCLVLKGLLNKPGDHTLWITSTDFILRRVIVDLSETAEEAAKQHAAIIANKELMSRLEERGIAPPPTIKHKDTACVTRYDYLQVAFDQSVTRLPQPV